MIKIEHSNPTQLAKRMMWLAYQASAVFGMGAMKARDSVTEEDVWKNVQNSGDYAMRISTSKDVVSADYVFGRMLKLDIRLVDNGVEVRDSPARLDYQSWARDYSTYEELAKAAVMDLATEPKSD